MVVLGFSGVVGDPLLCRKLGARLAFVQWSKGGAELAWAERTFFLFPSLCLSLFPSLFPSLFLFPSLSLFLFLSLYLSVFLSFLISLSFFFFLSFFLSLSFATPLGMRDLSSPTKDQTRVLFPGGSDGKASAYNAGDPGLIPGLGGSPGEGNGNPLQYSCLENPMDGGAW